jgi:3-methyl-2-oxobutanoate hydroxymethyltransferase
LSTPRRQKTLTDIYKLYASNTPISVITAHDFISATWADNTENVDMVLVGDSLAMVAKGHASTLELDFDDFYYSTKSVTKAINSKFLIVDFPFGSFESSITQCMDTAVRLMKLGKIGSLKLEGSYEITNHIKTLTSFGIPITGHIGLQPQKYNLYGGFRAQGRTASNALEIFKQAIHLQNSGCKMLVLECIPEKLSQYITQNLNIPTIGIGAGNKTSGQVLVLADALGMLPGKKAKFVNPYLDMNTLATQALQEYSHDVKFKTFPQSGKHTYPMDDEEFHEFEKLAKLAV